MLTAGGSDLQKVEKVYNGCGNCIKHGWDKCKTGADRVITDQVLHNYRSVL